MNDGLGQICPIHEGSPRQRPSALHACRDQHFCDVRDPAGIDGGNGRGNILIFCSPGPDGSLQAALGDKGSPHEMFETVWFSFRCLEVANNLFRRALLPALQDLRSEIGDVAKVPVKTYRDTFSCVAIGPTFRALAPPPASVRSPCSIQSDFVKRSSMVVTIHKCIDSHQCIHYAPYRGVWS